TADGRGVADETVRRNQDTRFALDWLEQERARVRRDGTLQGLRVTERNREEARRERSEAIFVKRLGGKTGNGSCAPVKIVLAYNDFGLMRGDALAGIAPAAGSLDRRFHRLRARVHGQDHLHAACLREFRDKERELIIAEGARG